MLDQRLSAFDAPPVGPELGFHAVWSLLETIDDLAVAAQNNVAPQQGLSASTPLSLATRYAAANSVTRRRFDAMLRESDTIARTGLGLIVSRSGKQDRSTIVAARFLGKSLSASLLKLDALLGPKAA